MADNEALVPIEMARLNITYKGQNGDMPDLVSFDADDNDIKQMASEAVNDGYVPGIDAHPGAVFNDFIVDRFEATDGVPFNRLVLRPKTPFGG